MPNQASGMPVGRCRVHGQARVQPGGRLVGQVAEGPPAGLDGPLDLVEHPHDLVGPIRPQQPVRLGEADRRVGAQIVEAGVDHRRIIRAADRNRRESG